MQPQPLPFPLIVQPTDRGPTPGMVGSDPSPSLDSRTSTKRPTQKLPKADPARIKRIERDIHRLLDEATGGDQAPLERVPGWTRRLGTLEACMSAAANPRLRQAFIIEAERIVAAMGTASATRRRLQSTNRQSRTPGR